ncbi:MAG: hypothetical protein F7B17_00015 [Desulfurococcales archaeon]|nr:hypothetical protein [Desulfurococcales archaeon]
MGARAPYLYCTPIIYYSPRSIVFRDVELKESSAVTSRWRGVIDYEGARFYLKVYEGDSKRAIEANLNSVVEANISVAKGFSMHGFNLGRMATDLVEGGVAPVMLVCRGAVEDGGELRSVLGLAAPYVEGENLLPYTLPRVEGSSEGLEEGVVRRVFCSLLEITARMHGLGVAHGDLKPANVILHSDRPVIIDFDGAVPATRGPPVFCFNPANGDLAEFSGVNADCSDPLKADWIGIIYTGTLLAHASKPVIEAREGASDPSIEDPRVRQAFESVMGRSFVEDLEAALKGAGPPDPSQPVAGLLERMRGEGVCG